jgi:hypothetical protein
MMELKEHKDQEEAEIRLLRDWLPRLGGEFRAYIKGVSTALLYVQELWRLPPGFGKNSAVPGKNAGSGDREE